VIPKRFLFNAAATLLLVAGSSAHAQTNPGWFVPSQPAAPKSAPAAAHGRAARPAQAVPPQDIGPAGGEVADTQAAPQEPNPNLPQPPVPALTDIPKGKAPPVAVMGVLSVPDVERQSSAAQAVARIINERKEKLHLEVERAQANWRELGQAFQAELPKLTQAAAQARERTLRERVNNERRVLQDRERIIQEAAQVSAGQIERTLVGIIRQVADSHGMNIVLHRSQVALNVQEFDITEDVVKQLNKVLPTVQIVPADVDPATLPKDWGTPPGASTPAPVPAKLH
jgi:Skp family chaperone for outer membrane proteins